MCKIMAVNNANVSIATPLHAHTHTQVKSLTTDVNLILDAIRG